MPDSTLLPPHPLSTFNVRRAGAEDRPVLERMWLLFRHDLSRFTGDLPRADGTFRSERLDAALTSPGWAAFLACCEDAPVGFACVRSLERQPFILNSFFVVAAARGTGVSSALAHQVVTTFPGRGRWRSKGPTASQRTSGGRWRQPTARVGPRNAAPCPAARTCQQTRG